MNKFNFEPDFENLRKVLLGGKGYRVPNMELVIDREIKDAFMGKPVVTLKDDIEFRYHAGYDYAWISIGMIDPAGTVNKDVVNQEDGDDKSYAGKDKRVWADEHSGRIKNRKDFESFPWPDPDKLDYSPFFEAGEYLKPGMKIIAILGKIFTASWGLMGLENFSLAMYDEPDLINDMVRHVGNIQLKVLKKIIDIDTIGAIWIPDDIAYNTGTMVPSHWLKTAVFPFYRQMAEICRKAGKPIIYHSDGDLSTMIDTIIDVGFNALHPIEPESMDIYELLPKVKNKLCLIGNIKVHSLATESQDFIRELVKDRIVNIGYKGAYCVGSSNSVPNFIPLENYEAMLAASADFGAINS